MVGARGSLIAGLGTGAIVKQICGGERVFDARGRSPLTLSNLTLTGGALTADVSGVAEAMLSGAGSVLIDAIPPKDCPTKLDARGIVRPQGSGCDVGAVEVK